MASLSSSNEEEAPSMNVQESHRLSIQRCIQSLVHACQCCHDNCPLPACQKMKRVVQHAKGCKSNGGCPVCKQVIALCDYHARHCQEDTCPVLFCLNIKQQIQRQQQQTHLGHPMAIPQQPLPSPAPGIPIQPRTPETLQPGMYSQPLLSPATPGIPIQQPSTPQPAPQPSPGGLTSPDFPNVVGIQSSRVASTNLLPVVPPAQPPPATFAAAHQMEPEEEQIYWVNIDDEISVRQGMVGPVNPLLQRSMNVPHPGPIAPPPIMQGMQPGQWSTAPMPQQSSMQQNIQHPVIEMTAALQAVVEPQLQAVSQQRARNISPNALQDLLRTLRSPSSPQQQQQQVLHILKSNPQLMAAFIKQRAAKYMANQPGMQPQQAPQQPPQQPGMHPQPVPSSATPGISMQLPSSPQFVQPAPQPSPGGMASLGSHNEDETESINPQEFHRLSIRRHIQSLEHASQCRNCSLPSCQKLKRAMQHLNECQHRPVCSVCRNLVVLCCYHAKQCRENMCPVMFCLNIKHKLRQRQLQLRLQQAQLLRRRLATRNTRTQGRTKG